MKKTIVYTILTGLTTLVICILTYTEWIYAVNIGDKYGASRLFVGLVLLIIVSVIGGIASILYNKNLSKYEKHIDESAHED